MKSIIMMASCILLPWMSYAQDKGCFELQTKEIFHNFDREFTNYEVQYDSRSKCQAAMNKIRVGFHGSKEVILLKNCSTCEKQERTSSIFGGSGSTGAIVPTSSNGNPSNSSSSPPSTPGGGPSQGSHKESTAFNTKQVIESQCDHLKDQNERNQCVASISPELLASGQNTQVEQTQRGDVLAETANAALPGVLNAVDRHIERNRQLKEHAKGNEGGKPEGFLNEYTLDDEWTFSSTNEQENTDSESEGDFWDRASEGFDILGKVTKLFSGVAHFEGSESTGESFGTASQVSSYLGTASDVAAAISDPDDPEHIARAGERLAHHASKGLGKFGGAAFSRAAPPVDLTERMLSGAIRRAESTMGGEPVHESEFLAPMGDWFGNIIRIGDAGTRSHAYRFEGHKSWGELRESHGWSEGTKRKLWYWMTGD